MRLRRTMLYLPGNNPNLLLRGHLFAPDGLILDGRNRSAACERAGVSPTTIVYEGDDLAEYVNSL